jgi:hypothetical protein
MLVMESLINVTPFSAGYVFGRDATGGWDVTAVVKASYGWDESGRVRAAPSEGLLDCDRHAGEPGASSVVWAAELGPRKARVDLLLAGAMVFARPTVEATVELRVGRRIVKAARVFGDRVWMAGGGTAGAAAVPSRARPVSLVPLLWERAFGGADPDDPTCVEPRNPVGVGMSRKAAALHGRPVPNVEHPREIIDSSKRRPPPVGFGPVAGHWQPRVALAGTYDDRWLVERNPLPPDDFDPAFHNVAPTDQQLPTYVAGELVVLAGMTPAGCEELALPRLAVPVQFATQDELREETVSVDTIVIEPERRRLSLLARAAIPLRDVLDLRQIVVGELTRAQRAALESGKAPRFCRRERAA